MSHCCGSKVAKKSYQERQRLSQESEGNSWLDKIKAAFGLRAKPVLNRKREDVRQQNHQQACCG